MPVEDKKKTTRAAKAPVVFFMPYTLALLHRKAPVFLCTALSAIFAG